MKLLTLETAKNAKTKKQGILTGVLFLAPHKSCGAANLCPYADGCQKLCLDTSGRLQFDTAERARLERTYWYLCDRAGFIVALKDDIEALERKAQREGLKPAVRLNGLSDLSWERIAPELFGMFPDVEFYDYTKNPGRYFRFLEGEPWPDNYHYFRFLEGKPWPHNYHLTFSRGENCPDSHVRYILNRGGTVAIVFDHVPDTWSGYRVVDGDKHDARWLDPQGVVVGLKAKGKARHSTSGFVVR